MRNVILTVFLTSVSPALAQQFVVDGNGGPSAHFTDITAAVAAVPDGSTLLVRAGVYAPVLIANKAITILCDAGVSANSGPSNGPFLEVRDTQPHAPVAVFNLHRAVPQFTSSVGGISIRNATGPVTIDGSGQVYAMPEAKVALTIQDATQVSIRRIQLTGSPGVRVENAQVVFESCDLRGRWGATTFFASPAQLGILAIDSELQLVHSSASGGNGSTTTFPFFLFTPPESAVQLTNSQLRMTGDASHELRGGNDPQTGIHIASLSGSGNATARIAPAITIVGPVAASVAVATPQMPSLRSAPTAPGQALSVERGSTTGSVSILALSVRSLGVLSIGQDPLWLDPISYVVVDIAVTPANGMVPFAFTVPNEPLLRGFQVVWQGVDLRPGSNLALSNPSPSFVR
tara:strand:+ start:2571 stop:3779 length:1209 start_codon:yes stop_codon:yes gene_type:complete